MIKCAGSLTCPKAGKRGNRNMCGRHYDLLRQQRIASGEWRGHVPAEPVREHVQKLTAAGITIYRIVRLTGLPERTLRELPNRKTVWSTTADKILSVEPTSMPREDETKGRVPVIGTRRRLQSLVAMGYTKVYLAEYLGMTSVAVTRLCLEFAAFTSVQATVETAKRVDKMWRELQHLPPPAGSPAVAARNRARKHGWVVPFAWDEDRIDDPTAEPYQPGTGRDAWFDDYEELKQMGLTNQQVAQRWGITRDGLQCRLRRRNERLAA